MKHFLFLFLISLSITLQAQETKPPVYPGCEEVAINELMGCFNDQLKAAVIEEFKVPTIAENENYKGTVKVVFVVTKEGQFEVLYVNAMYQELEDEVHRVFKTLPSVQAQTYNGRSIDERYRLPIAIPLSDNDKKVVVVEDKKDIEDEIPDLANTLFPEFQSELNIPFV